MVLTVVLTVVLVPIVSALAAEPEPEPETEPAPSADGRARVHWQAPSSCPDAAQVEAQLTAALGSAAGSLQIQVTVTEPGPGAYRADVQLRGPGGETTRTLQSPTCATLVQAVVLLAVVSVNASESDPLTVPEPESEPEPEPEPASSAAEVSGGGVVATDDVLVEAQAPEPTEVVPSERSTAADARPSPSTWSGVARLAPRAGAGILPGVDLSAAAAIGVRRAWVRVELLGAGFIPRRQVVTSDAAVRLTLITGELRGCGEITVRAWLGVLPCVGLESGGMRGRGEGGGLAVRRTSWQAWLAVGLTPAVTLRLSRSIGIWAGGSVVLPLRRLGFTLRGESDEAHRIAPVSGRAAIGVELHFPS